ncbi:MAG: prepilin-type N-terminal cleavage/methylation domain-containing protein [Candidatus Levybacteria bacterium]|nr:prepilin-type N-terminal cleavage/methylation domain-containing protein [Candidatus Levybacteria bacterium]
MDKENHKSYIINLPVGKAGPKSRLGFTLIELILTTAIFLLIGTFSANFYTNFLIQNTVSDVQDQYIGSLRKAQMYAMMSKNSNNWGVHYATGTITLFSGTSFALRNQALDEKFTVNPNISITGTTDILFARMTGLPDPSSGSISIQGNSETKTITVNSQGVASR